MYYLYYSPITGLLHYNYEPDNMTGSRKCEYDGRHSTIVVKKVNMYSLGNQKFTEATIIKSKLNKHIINVNKKILARANANEIIEEIITNFAQYFI